MYTKKGYTLYLYLTTKGLDIPWNKWTETLNLLSNIVRHSITHHKLAEDYCNGPIDHSYDEKQYDQWENTLMKRSDNLEKRITYLVSSIPGLTCEFQGDPRGYTVKLKFNGSYIGYDYLN